MWKDLTLKEKAEIMKMSVANGVTDINDIKAIYDNETHNYQLGGYKQWKNAIAKYKHLDIDNDPTYDYEGFYNSDPVRAWNLLNEDPSAHFVDNFKTAQHPTFSKESDYSGKFHPIYNPQGIEGGAWGNRSFTLSKDWQKGPSLQDRISYLEDAEDEGVTLYGPNGELPVIYNNDVWGGVLPNVDVYNKALGGYLYKNAGPLNKGKAQPKYQYGIIEQILRENGVNFRVTSGARKPNQAGNAGKGSAHTYTIFGNSPGAIDIVPGVGSDWNTLFAQMNSPKVRRALAMYGLDVLNETNPSVMKDTHATGPHLHVGRGIKGQSGAGIMYGGTTFGGDKGSIMPQYSGGSDYTSMMQQQAMEPITLAGSNATSPWLDYIGKIGQQRPVTFNTSTGTANNLASNNQLSIGPINFDNIGSSDELMSFNPYTRKQDMEYSLGLENNALWNSPYLLFNAHSAANGGHLFDDGSMLLKGNDINPAYRYVYGDDYETIVKQNREAIKRAPIRARSNQRQYSIKQESDVVANASASSRNKIRLRQTDSPTRRQTEQAKANAAHQQYLRERQGNIGAASNPIRHPDYNPQFANEVQRLREQEAKEEQKAYNRRVLESNVLEGLEAIPWPSTVAGSLFNPNTHWYDPFSFFSNLYANDNRGFFNYNQATRDFYDANPEVGAVANLIGDFVVPGAAAKALKGIGKIPEVSRNLVASTAINHGAKTRVLPTNIYKQRRMFNVGNGMHVWDNDPFVEFINSKRGVPSNTSYFFRMPNNVDVLKARNGAYRAKGNDYVIHPGGTVDGKFVSYGEPWMEFGTGQNSAWYEFPTMRHRGPHRMATDWRGNIMDYTTQEAYDQMAIRRNPEFIRENEELIFKDFNSREEALQAQKDFNEKWGIDPSVNVYDIYHSNQTVIPNREWNFNSEYPRGFLSQPFWRYTADPYSGAMQKELMMNWETPMKALDRTHADIIPFIDPETGTWDYLTSDVHISPDYSKFSFTTGDKKFDTKLFEDFLNGRIKSPTQVPKSVPTKNIPKNSTFKIDTDKRLKLSLGSPSRILATDIGKLTEAEVEAMFGPRAVYWKKMYDVAKNHNFEGKFKAIGEQAEREIRSRFSINREDPDIKTAIDKAKRLYDIPEYRARFERFGTLGDTFIDDALNRIKNMELQGVSKDYKIIGQHGVKGGASAEAHPVNPKITIKDSDSSRAIQELMQHEVNHAAHGMKYQPEWMKYHNERIRPKPRRESSTPGAKYMNEMDEIVERAKTTVEWADRIRKPGESLDDVLSRVVDDFESLDGFKFAKKYKDIPGDTKSYLLFFEPKTGKKFLQNFVGSFIVGTTGVSLVN